MNADFPRRTLRRLSAAEGFFELNMHDHALEELNSIEDAGPLEPAVHLLRGEIFKAQSRFDDAIEPLKKAAQLIPAPHNSNAWLSLSECYRSRGENDLADMAASLASVPVHVVQNVVPVFNVSITILRRSHTAEEPELLDETDYLE